MDPALIGAGTGLEALVGILLPPFVDLVNKHVKNTTWRYLVSLFASLLVGAALNWSQLTLQDVLQSGGIIFASAQTVYKVYWQKSKLRTLVK